VSSADDQTGHLLWRLRNGELPQRHEPRVIVLLAGTTDVKLAHAAHGEEGIIDAANGIASRWVPGCWEGLDSGSGIGPGLVLWLGLWLGLGLGLGSIPKGLEQRGDALGLSTRRSTLNTGTQSENTEHVWPWSIAVHRACAVPAGFAGAAHAQLQHNQCCCDMLCFLNAEPVERLCRLPKEYDNVDELDI